LETRYRVGVDIIKEPPANYRLWKLMNLIVEANTSQKRQMKPINTAAHTPNIECLKSKYDRRYSLTVVPTKPGALIVVSISPNCDATKPYRVHATGLR
jgi:hypothetical protein